jgi:hypothetical protein
VVEGALARARWAPDCPFGFRDEEFEREAAEEERGWGTAEHSAALAEFLAASASDKDRRGLATMIRQGASPGAAAALDGMNQEIDVRPALSAVHVPTLVLNRAEELPFIVASSRYLAEHIPGARHVTIPGSDHALFASYADRSLGEIEAFLRDAWEAQDATEETERVLATVLFTDIVGSTERAIELGDARWRELLETHHALVRRQLVRFRGREIDTAGDGFFASFDGPARAIGCAGRRCVRPTPV